MFGSMPKSAQHKLCFDIIIILPEHKNRLLCERCERRFHAEGSVHPLKKVFAVSITLFACRYSISSMQSQTVLTRDEYSWLWFPGFDFLDLTHRFPRTANKKPILTMNKQTNTYNTICIFASLGASVGGYRSRGLLVQKEVTLYAQTFCWQQILRHH